MTNQINLLGPISRGGVIPRYIRILHSIALVLLFVVPTLAVILYIFIALSPLPSLNKQEQDSLSQLSNYRQQFVQLLYIRQRAGDIQTIIETRPDYDVLLETLRNEVPAGLGITAYTIGLNTASITVTGNSLALINEFMRNLTTDPASVAYFHNIQMDSLTHYSDTQNIEISVHMSLLKG
jgi:Tfp pilus assembly protein PilN